VTYSPPRSASPQQVYHGPEAAQAAYAPQAQAAPDWSDWNDYGAVAPVDFRAAAAQAKARKAAQQRQPARPPAFGLTPAGQLAISPWWALGIVAGLVGLGVFVEYRYKLTQRAEAKIKEEVEDTKAKAKATRSAIRDETRRRTAKLRATRRRFADRLHGAIAGDAEEDEA